MPHIGARIVPKTVLKSGGDANTGVPAPRPGDSWVTLWGLWFHPAGSAQAVTRLFDAGYTARVTGHTVQFKQDRNGMPSHEAVAEVVAGLDYNAEATAAFAAISPEHFDSDTTDLKVIEDTWI